MKNYLNFESNIKELEAELDSLKVPFNKEGLTEVDTNKISSLQEEIDSKLRDIYTNLDPWQKHWLPDTKKDLSLSSLLIICFQTSFY